MPFRLELVADRLEQLQFALYQRSGEIIAFPYDFHFDLKNYLRETGLPSITTLSVSFVIHKRLEINKFLFEELDIDWCVAT